jgi:hypothetical protein
MFPPLGFAIQGTLAGLCFFAKIFNGIDYERETTNGVFVVLA